MALERILNCADGGSPVIVEPYLVAGQTFVENNLLARLEALERIRTRPVRACVRACVRVLVRSQQNW